MVIFYYFGSFGSSFSEETSLPSSEVLLFCCALGANITSILFPSIFGNPSRAPTSLRRSANFNNNNSPLSLNMMARPLNCTCAFTLSPSVT